MKYFKSLPTKITQAITCAMLASTPALAQYEPSPCPWIFSGSLGYAKFSDMYKNDGQTPVGRLSVGKEFSKTDELAFGSEMYFGLEFGLQSGNSMRLGVPQETLDLFGGGSYGLPIQTTIKPMLDLLFTIRTNTLENAPLFMQLKVGGMYRQWQFDDRDTINTLSQIAPELQFGLGYLINERAFASLYYQGVYGGSPDLVVDASDLSHVTGRVNNIPSQNAIFLGLSFTL